MMSKEDNIKDYYLNKKEKTTYKCNETNEIFKSFKAWCRRNKVYYSKYYLMKSLADNSKYYNTKYSFIKIIND